MRDMLDGMGGRYVIWTGGGSTRCGGGRGGADCASSGRGGGRCCCCPRVALVGSLTELRPRWHPRRVGMSLSCSGIVIDVLSCRCRVVSLLSYRVVVSRRCCVTLLSRVVVVSHPCCFAALLCRVVVCSVVVIEAEGRVRKGTE